MKKYLKPVLALVLVASLAIGGTLAYLTDVTDEKVNDFTVDKKVDIELTEDEKDWELIPGEDFEKNPTITVKQDEAYVFTKVVETMPTKAFTMGTATTDDDRDFNYYVDYDINGLYTAEPKVAGGTIYRVDADGVVDEANPIDWYWMLIEGETTASPAGTYENEKDEYTTVTYKYALVDSDGNLLEVSSTDVMSGGKGGFIPADYPILKDDKASIPSTLTQDDLGLFVSSTDDEVTYSADLSFVGYAIQTSGLENDGTAMTTAEIYAAAEAGETQVK